MTGKPIVITVPMTIDRQTVNDIIDTALAGGWSWWGDLTVVDADGTRTYVLEVLDDWGAVEQRVTFSYGHVAEAIRKIATGKYQLRDDLKKQVLTAITNDPDLDADASDCVLQFALFGELVFG
jgi:hypothetical protein